MVGATGFEPAAPWSQTRCATKLRHAPFNSIIIYCLFDTVKSFLKNTLLIFFKIFVIEIDYFDHL